MFILILGVVGIIFNVGWVELEDLYNLDYLEVLERDILFNFGWFVNLVVYGNYF